MSPGDQIDLSSDPGDESANEPTKAGRPRDFLGVHYACCSVYARAYPTPDGAAFLGRCPRCGRSIRFDIDPDGDDERFVSVS